MSGSTRCATSPRRRPPPLGLVGQLVETVPDAGPPLLPGRGDQPLGHFLVAGQVTGLQQAQRDPQVAAGDAQRLADGPHRVVQPDAGVPQRVPQLLGDRSMSLRPLWTRTRSRSEPGTSSRRPSAPTAINAAPVRARRRPAWAASQNSCRSTSASRRADAPSRRASARANARRPRPARPRRPFPQSLTARRCRVPRSAPGPRSPPADPDLAVADLAGAGRLDHGVHHLVRVRSSMTHLDPQLGHEVHGVLGAAVDLGVALLPAEALHLADRHAQHAQPLQRRLDVVQHERLDDRRHQLHDLLPSRIVPSRS